VEYSIGANKQLRCIVSNNGQFRNCQSWSFITVYGQFQSIELRLYCHMTIRPSKYVQKKVYFLFVINLITRTMGYSNSGRRLKFCGTLHWSYIQNILMLFVSWIIFVRCPSGLSVLQKIQMLTVSTMYTLRFIFASRCIKIIYDTCIKTIISAVFTLSYLLKWKWEPPTQSSSSTELSWAYVNR